MRNTLSLFFCLMLLVSCGSADVEVVSSEPVTELKTTVGVAVKPEPTVELEPTQEALEEEVPVKVDEPVKVNPAETESEKPVEEARSIEEMRDEVHVLLDEITEADDTVSISFSMQVDNPIAVK